MQLPPAPPAEAVSTTETNLHPSRCAEQAGWCPGDTDRVSWDRVVRTRHLPCRWEGEQHSRLPFRAATSPGCRSQSGGHTFQLSSARSQGRGHVPRCSAAAHTSLTQNRALHMKNRNVGTQPPKSRPPPASSLQV